jgi:hypothetical protein
MNTLFVSAEYERTGMVCIGELSHFQPQRFPAFLVSILAPVSQSQDSFVQK